MHASCNNRLEIQLFQWLEIDQTTLCVSKQTNGT
jgi:hypothetical protein